MQNILIGSRGGGKTEALKARLTVNTDVWLYLRAAQEYKGKDNKARNYYLRKAAQVMVK